MIHNSKDRDRKPPKVFWKWGNMLTIVVHSKGMEMLEMYSTSKILKHLMHEYKLDLIFHNSIGKLSVA